MTLRRTLFIALAVVLTLGGIALAVVFTPSFQRWAVRRAVAGQPGMKVDLERISAGLRAFEGRGLRIESHGIVVEVASFDGRYALWPALTGRRLDFSRLAARGVRIDASRLTPAETQAGAAAAPAATPGVISRIELPMEIVLGQCDIEGSARLPGPAGGEPVVADFRVTGGRIAPGTDGELHLQARLANPAPEARVRELRARVDLQLAQSLHRTFDRVGLVAVVEGDGPAVPEGSRLRIAAGLSNAAGSESYSLAIETLRGDTADRLCTLNAKLADAGRFDGDWALNVRTAQVEPFFLGGMLPQFELRGAGGFSFAPASGDASLRGWLESSAHGLEAWQPALRPLGVVEVDAGFDIERNGGTLVLNRLDATVIGDRPVLEIHTGQAVRAAIGGPDLNVSASTPGEVLRVKLPGLPLAWVRPFIHDADVSGGTLSGEIALSTDGRNLTARTVAPLRVDSLNVVQEGRALLLKAETAAEFEATLAEREWTGRVGRLTLATPAGDQVSAQFSASQVRGEQPTLRLAGRLESRLPTLLENWLAGLKTAATGEFDVALTGTALSVARLSGELRQLDGPRLAAVSAARPFRFDLSSRSFAAADGRDGGLLDFELGRIDLAPLLGGFPTGLSGTIAGGAFRLAVADGRWELRATKPLTIAGFDLAGSDGKGGLGGLNLVLQPRVVPEGAAALHLETGEFSAQLPDGTELLKAAGDVRLGGDGMNAAGTFGLELPALSRLPAFATANALSQGRASGEMRAVLGAQDRQAEARITLNGLVARDGGQPLPVANISFRGVSRPDGSASVQVPVLFDRSGVRSDLEFSASLERSGPGHRLEASLTGEHASLEDILAVMGVFSATAATGNGPEKPAAARGRAPVVADTVPPWARFTGHIGLGIKSVTHGKEWSMTGLSGDVMVGPAAVTLEKLEAAFGEKGRFTAKGGLGFAPGAQPYRLAGDFSLTEFDAGPLFKALEPGRAPTVEGVFAVDGHVEGAGRTVDETVELVRGRFSLTSRQGVFRGLKRGTEKLSVASKAVELGAALGSLFGSDKVREAAEKVAGNAYFADQLAQELGELKYDQLAVQLARDDTLNVHLSEISLISPEVRLVGKGTVTHVEGTPLLEQPLSVDAAIASRGKIETLFGRARLLEGGRDELGYARTKYPVVIGGTLAKPDAVSFYSRLAASKLIENLTGDN